jgi:DNA-directed RNA polymerase I subunit RPA2
MPSSTSTKTNTKWTTEFDTVRRQKLFKSPPADRTAYPLLAATIEPHIQSFNSIFEPNGLLEEALKDIGTKVFLDGNPLATDEDAPTRNTLSIRVRDVILQKAQLPPTNKFNVRHREILPSECRERHATYRGKLTARLEFRVNNGDWKDLSRDIGQMPIMLRVCENPYGESIPHTKAIMSRSTDAMSSHRID